MISPMRLHYSEHAGQCCKDNLYLCFLELALCKCSFPTSHTLIPLHQALSWRHIIVLPYHTGPNCTHIRVERWDSALISPYYSPYVKCPVPLKVMLLGYTSLWSLPPVISVLQCAWACMLNWSDSCDVMDCSPPGSSVHGILQARILEWVAIPSSRGSS